MEKRKLLLISISIGIFLVIIIGASILMFSPKEPVLPVTADLSRPIPPGTSDLTRNEQTPPQKMDLTELVKNPDEIKGLQVPPSASTIQENNNNIYINGEPLNIQGEFMGREQTTDGTGTRTNLVINIPAPKTPVVPDPAPSPEKPAASPAPAKKPAATASRPKPKPAAVKPAAAAASPAPKGRTNFWVQTGAFSTQNRAEGVKETLAAKGIASIIENRSVNGQTFYRVRVGPYASNSEAAYWLSLIKQINGFEDSQIWQNQSRL